MVLGNLTVEKMKIFQDILVMFITPHTIHRGLTATNTFFFCSSVLTSLRTLAQGTSLGHHTGRHSVFPHPGLLLPVEYLSISGINARNCACQNRKMAVSKYKAQMYVPGVFVLLIGHHYERWPMVRPGATTWAWCYVDSSLACHDLWNSAASEEQKPAAEPENV